MFYLQSEPKGFVDKYSIWIEVPDLPRDLNFLYCIVSDLQFENDNIDEVSDFVSYASTAKLTIAFQNIQLYETVLRALYTSQDCIIKKNGIDYFKGTIDEKDNIEFQVEDREITFTIVSSINKLKSIKVTDVLMEDYGVTKSHNPNTGEDWYRITDVIKVYFQHIGFEASKVNFNNLFNITACIPSYNGQVVYDYFIMGYFQFKYIVALNPQITIWDMLKQIFNLFCIDCYVVGDEVVIQNKFLWRNPNVPVTDLSNRFSISSSYKTRAGKKGVTVTMDTLSYSVGTADSNNDVLVSTQLLNYGFNNQWNSQWSSFGIYCPSDRTVNQVSRFNLVKSVVVYNQIGYNTANTIYENVKDAKFVIDTEVTGEFDITNFYILAGRYYKVSNYSFDAYAYVSKITLCEVHSF